jgi:3-phenylpropionate/trans-cinnamate dioxygenase ferredoxin reductase subunit
MRRIAIVGGGQAGAYAATTLRASGFDGRLTLVSEEESAPYERPPLSKEFLLGHVDEAALRVLPAEFWLEEQVELELGRRATRIVPGEGVVIGDTLLRVDGVVLCTGASARRLTVPGSDLRGVHVLRTIEDARALREELVAGARVIVVGGGLIGSELASTAAAIGADVTVLDIAEVPLARAVGEVVGRRLADEAACIGVKSRQGSVERFEGASVVTGVLLEDGSALDADVVIVGVGAEPRTDVAEASGLRVRNGVLCDIDGRTSLANVTVAGDVAHVSHGATSGRTEHWKSAIEQGGRAARALLGIHNPPVEPVWFWSEQYDQRVEVAGELAGDHVVVRGDRDGNAFTVWYLDAHGALVGAVGLNRPRDVRTATKILTAGGTSMNPAILQDEGTSILEAVAS